MKIKDIFLIIAVFCATVLPATMVVFGGLIFFSSCADTPASAEKVYAIKWCNGINAEQTGTWITEEELSLGQYQFDPYTGSRFQVISIPSGCRVRAIKAGTDKTAIITVDRYASKGDTIMGPDGVYYIPK
jgi:hypothetical protein